jgi:hypothetical protein
VQTGKEFTKIGIKDGRVEGVGQGVWRTRKAKNARYYPNNRIGGEP